MATPAETVDSVLEWLLADNMFWNHETLECVFYDPTFDELPYSDGRTLGISKCRKVDGHLEYVSSDYDEDIDIEAAVMRIVNEPGWRRDDSANDQHDKEDHS